MSSGRDARHDSAHDSAATSSQDADASSPKGTGRREFLRFAGVSFAAACLPEALSGCAIDTSPAGSAEAVAAARASLAGVTVDPLGWINVVRPDDMLRMRINFVNLPASGGIRKPQGGNPGVVLIELPPQHIVEVTQPEPPTPPPASTLPPPIAARIANPTRLAFIVQTTQQVPDNLPDLLDALTKLDLNLPDNAVDAVDDAPPAAPPSPTVPATAPPVSSILDTFQSARQARSVADVLLDAAPAFDTSNDSATGPMPVDTPDDAWTNIELPFRLRIAPGPKARFAHAGKPATSTATNRTEVWSTRLSRAAISGGGADESLRLPLQIRAVGARDAGVAQLAADVAAGHAPTLTPNEPFPDVGGTPPVALTAYNRAHLVVKSSALKRSRTRPIRAKRLLLTSLGGTLDAKADFSDDPSIGLTPELIKWDHRAAIGRDNYVRVEDKGFLFPWGHPASLVTITERKFLPNAGGAAGPRTAFLWTRYFILIREPVADYFDAPMSTNGRNLPIRRVRITTHESAQLDPINAVALVRGGMFWPTVNGSPFRFAAEFQDIDGNVHKADLAALWVADALHENLSSLQTAKTMFTTPLPNGSIGNVTGFNRQRIAYAPTIDKPETKGKTTFETSNITFDTYVPQPSTTPPVIQSPIGIPGSITPFAHVGPIIPLFFPVIKQTEVTIESIRQFVGTDQAIKLVYAERFMKNGGFSNPFDQNPGEVLFRLDDTAATLQADLGSQSNRGGGFLAPSLGIAGISRLAGPLGVKTSSPTSISDQIDQIAQTANVDSSKFFGELSSAKLFGVFSLGDILGALPLDKLPKFATETLDTLGAFARTISQVQSAINSANDAITALGSGVPSAISALQTSFTTALGKIDDALKQISAPSLDASYATALSSVLSALQSSANDVHTALGNARQAIAQAASAAPIAIDDSLLATADRLVLGVSAMLANPSALVDAAKAIAASVEASLHMTSRIDWKVPLTINVGAPGFPNIFKPRSDAALELAGEVRAHEVNGKPAGIDISAALTNFDINLVGDGSTYFFKLGFNAIKFEMAAGHKADISVDFGGLTFEGPISFLNALKEIIPLNGFSDPPGIQVTSSGIEASFSIALPSLAVGVFALENISLGASLKVPFIGEPLSVGFHFCDRDNPFHLTVSLLGGGGFFGMELSLQGVILVEASIEFGAEISVDLVVASGSVSLMAGIYFAYKSKGVDLSGYVRLRGTLSVLGLISCTVELYMELGYEGETKSAHGLATISIEISIAFFSESVNVTAEKRFSSCNADPSFADVIAAQPKTLPDGTAGFTSALWDTYCDAFAPIV